MLWGSNFFLALWGHLDGSFMEIGRLMLLRMKQKEPKNVLFLTEDKVKVSVRFRCSVN